jgi:hypothetical protein
MAEVAFEIVEAMRIKHSDGRTGEIVDESFPSVSSVQSSNPKQQPQKFLVFAVHADDRIGRVLEFFAVPSDDFKLSIAAGMMTDRQDFAGFSSIQAVSFQKLRDDGHADAEAQSQEFVGDLRLRKIGPENARLVGIACRIRIDDFQERIIEAGQKREAGLSSAPFFLAR